jgi:hypothetical protein
VQWQRARYDTRVLYWFVHGIVRLNIELQQCLVMKCLQKQRTARDGGATMGWRWWLNTVLTVMHQESEVEGAATAGAEGVAVDAVEVVVAVLVVEEVVVAGISPIDDGSAMFCCDVLSAVRAFSNNSCCNVVDQSEKYVLNADQP